MFKFLKSKKKRKIFVIIVTVIMLGIAGVFGYLAWGQVSQFVGTEVKDNSRNIEKYGYYLRDDATEYQQQLFDILKALCKEENPDPETLAMCVAQNYVADFFTFDNKTGNYDVGGICYTNKDVRNNFYAKARDMFYQNLTAYKNKYGESNLLEVVASEANIAATDTYTLYDVAYTRYYVLVSWTYKDGNVLAKKFQTSNLVMVIDNDGRMEITEIYETE